MKKADLIIDLQYGSTGKGLLAGFMGATGEYDTVINANMPNAGHTYIDVCGNKMMHKVLPNGLVGKSVKRVMIAAGSIFDPKVLEREIAMLNNYGYKQFNVFIHEDAVVLDYRHTVAEQTDTTLEGIGSTRQGTSAAMIQKLLRNGVRNPTVKTADKSCWYFKYTIVTQHQWLLMLKSAEEILIEGAQGYSLGINAGFYPFSTSRDCTPARFMADCGVPLPYLRRVIGTARLHPIRVGGNSGPCYPDQTEISWEALGQEPEKTTVTQRVRRVFTWSQLQIEEAILACQPDEVFLNFCNYDPDGVEKIVTKIHKAGSNAGCHANVRYKGWGPSHLDVVAGLMSPYEMTKKEIKRGTA